MYEAFIIKETYRRLQTVFGTGADVMYADPSAVYRNFKDISAQYEKIFVVGVNEVDVEANLGATNPCMDAPFFVSAVFKNDGTSLVIEQKSNLAWDIIKALTTEAGHGMEDYVGTNGEVAQFTGVNPSSQFKIRYNDDDAIVREFGGNFLMASVIFGMHWEFATYGDV